MVPVREKHRELELERQKVQHQTVSLWDTYVNGVATEAQAQAQAAQQESQP
jgi:hypothetical protein